MNEYRVVWQLTPFAYTEPHVVFVTAGDEIAAGQIALDYVERKHGVALNPYNIRNVRVATAIPLGKVKTEE